MTVLRFRRNNHDTRKPRKFVFLENDLDAMTLTDLDKSSSRMTYNLRSTDDELHVSVSFRNSRFIFRRSFCALLAVDRYLDKWQCIDLLQTRMKLFK